MAFPNITDLAATTIERRSGKIADGVTKNNAILAWLKKAGNIKPVPGGTKILEELSYAENGNFNWYSGYETLGIAPTDVISAAEFSWKQAAAAVTISGLELLQNSGREAVINLLDSRLGVAESTMQNGIAGGLYSNGTTFGGKVITGLQLAVAFDPTTGTYGGIDRATWTFWRNQTQDLTKTFATASTTEIKTGMNAMWAKLVRGSDRPNLILADTAAWTGYQTVLQEYVRITDSEGQLGFPSIKFMDADVVLDGGMGGFCPSDTMYFLNTKYLFFKPHKDRNMVPLTPTRRTAVNQDAEVQILAWAGNLTCSNASLQGVFGNITP